MLLQSKEVHLGVMSSGAQKRWGKRMEVEPGSYLSLHLRQITAKIGDYIYGHLRYHFFFSMAFSTVMSGNQKPLEGQEEI